MSTDLQIKKLEHIIENLKDIHKFVGDPYYKINKSILEINQRVSMNSKNVEKFRAYKKSKPSPTEKHLDLGLEIASENFVILNQKNELIDFYIKDIYERIEKIGKSVTDHATILKDVLNRLDSLEG